jgi:UDP-N-acetylmuramyl pentapeptide phosphotransferase/UDP-N-acetylglucosamine-1-phosphate transferase
MTLVAVAFLVALAASLVLTPICRRAAYHFGYVAAPKDDRWHKRPTALFGGVAIAWRRSASALTVGQRLRCAAARHRGVDRRVRPGRRCCR